MPASYRTAADAAEMLAEAAQAVRDYYASGPDNQTEVGQRARRAIDLAMFLDGITTAQIATAAGVRQLLVARLVDNPDHRRRALVAARHDADRYRDQVLEAIRSAVQADLAELDWERLDKTAYAQEWGISRPTLYDWHAAQEGGDTDG